MSRVTNTRYNDGLHESSVYFAAYARHDSPELDVPSELVSASSDELVPLPPTDMPSEDYHSPLELASLISPSPTMFSTTALAVGPHHVGRSGEASSNREPVKASQSTAIDGRTVLVTTLTLCLFIGLAVWLTVSVHSQMQDSDLGAVGVADDRMRLENHGVPPSRAASDHEEMLKREWEIALELRQPTTGGTSSPLPMESDVDVKRTLVYRDDDYDDERTSTVDVEGDHTEESTSLEQPDVDDADTTHEPRRVFRKHRTPSLKPRYYRTLAERNQ
ncbi:hypothetical protein MTO96_022197 [Rhipicephalus appendiculatus]